MSKNDGGPAFPTEGFVKYPTINTNELPPSQGMSLRDWFAGMALSTDMAFMKIPTGEFESEMTARHAYEVADAMLKERGRDEQADK